MNQTKQTKDKLGISELCHQPEYNPDRSHKTLTAEFPPELLPMN